MKYIFLCRRTFISLIGIIVLTYLGANGADVAGTIGFIVAALAGANATEKVMKK